jgi:hypothetical protein
MGLLFPAHEYWVDRRLLGSCPETLVLPFARDPNVGHTVLLP